MVIWLDLPYWLILYQVITRTFRRSLRREVLWAGNTESLFKAFFRCDSIILWSLTNLQRVRQQYVREMSDPVNEHIRFVRLRSRGEMNGFLLDIEEAVSAGQAWQ